MEIKFILARDMRINCSLLYVLKNAAGSFLATDNTHVRTQSAIQIFVWNLVANELMQNAAKSLGTDQPQVESTEKFHDCWPLEGLSCKLKHVSVSSPFFAFGVLIISFPQRRGKVVYKAKRPKYFGSLRGGIKHDRWACHSGLSGT